MSRGQIVALPTVVIPPENTPEKKTTEMLVAHPQWRYVGPADTINFEWQIGLWNSTFNGITARKYDTRSQPASAELKTFTCDLPTISLSPLAPGFYDCEISFKGSFPDLRVIVENCVKVAPEAPLWQYGQPSGSIGKVYSPTPNTWFISFACKVTNPGNVKVTKSVILYINTGLIDVNQQNIQPYSAVKTLNVTLGAGESFAFTSEGEILVTWEQVQNRLDHYRGEQYVGFPCYLQDSDGTQSPIGTIF